MDEVILFLDHHAEHYSVNSV